MKKLVAILAVAALVLVAGTVNANNPVIVAQQKAMVMESLNDINFEDITLEKDMPSLVRVVFHLEADGSFVVDGMSVDGNLAYQVKQHIEDANIEKTLVFGEKYGVNIRFTK
eukprot:Anaeramoba_ignava/a218190_23.p2 GENE.a218190_23~~a218190_23.p2  ORF type:complete len:112 (+),score=10.58 a218190_23:998-1333(+)